MIDLPAELLPQSDEDKFLRQEWKARWEGLKPVIVKLYTGNYGKSGKPATINEIADAMRRHYSFHAAASEYPHWFRRWGVSDRRLTKELVEEIATALSRHSRPGMSTSRVAIKRGSQEEPLDTRKAKRHLKGKDSAVPPEGMQPGWLSSWILPYAAFASALPINPEEASPYGVQRATPKCLTIRTPEATSPDQVTDEASPNLQLFYQKAIEFRSSLFLQGRLKELMISMGQHDRELFVDYFHQLYMYGFCSAKNWNSSFTIPPTIPTPAFTPQMWNATSPWTPSVFIDLPSSPSVDITMPPTQLCQWSIHVPEIEYEPIPAEQDSLSPDILSFTNSLQEVITSGSSVVDGSGDLPVSREIISQSLKDNPTALQSESLRLAIMAGNYELLDGLLEKILDGSDYDYTNQILPEILSIHPYHLAASYLNGGGPCCMIFNTLNILMPSYLFRNSLDDLGHTILDSFMVSILRSHSSVRPEIVNHDFGALSRFPGEEKDTCGRWDADSPEVRELFSQGYSRIPTSWKHPFCHSAVQAVCHALMIMFGSDMSPDINSLSGLFLRRCTECGIELRLGPVHTLIVTAFFLGQSGMAGETLFGPMAILVCLIGFGADVTLRAHVSIEEIIGISTELGQCHHTSLSAAELIQAVPARVIQNWSDDCQVGWSCLHQVILQAEVVKRNVNFNTNSNTGWEEMSETGSSHGSQGPDCGFQCKFDHDGLQKFQCTGPMIGLAWATIQAELLTYRRVGDTDPWISNNFPMRALNAWLKLEIGMFESPLVRDQKLELYSICGWFISEQTNGDVYQYWYPVWPMAGNVCRKRFDLMDDYKRSSFIAEIHLTEL
ncbi:uncharacterized protein FTOL_06376 [Fusarium torulosum]|uniref:Clr5 domain-containing protein n=1 Tax=Fusarium torulosum TaxID=33205 RepID=A0AAE8M9A3_9HYPO|nr:uncharacterized protein FTOL_06376 [Fusarium torulosum]